MGLDYKHLKTGSTAFRDPQIRARYPLDRIGFYNRVDLMFTQRDTPMSKVVKLPKAKETSSPTPDRSVEARWGKKLVQDGFCPISSFFLHNYHRLSVCPGKRKRTLNTTEAMVIIQLFDFKWDERDVFPAVGTIASRIGREKRTVRDALKVIDDAKLIERKFSRSGGVTRYCFDGLIAQLEKLHDEDQAKKAEEEDKETVKSAKENSGVK
jgi:Helix-turn-helix domain